MKTMMCLSVAALCVGVMTGCDSMCAKSGSCSECGGAGMTKAQGPGAGGDSCAFGACKSKVPAVATPSMKVGTVSTDALMTMMRAKTPMTLLDARAGKYDDGTRIPGAKGLAVDATDAQVSAMLPDKQALVVTYCANVQCPASQMLGDKLRKLGYVNVLEYREGIEGWRAAGNTIEKAAP